MKLSCKVRQTCPLARRKGPGCRQSALGTGGGALAATAGTVGGTGPVAGWGCCAQTLAARTTPAATPPADPMIRNRTIRISSSVQGLSYEQPG